jgi:putative intracellular protease/amidase
MKILMVMTSHSKLGNTGHKTGVWLEEFAAPYFVFRDAGLDITLASPRGGHPPIDPRSERPEAQTVATHRLYADRRRIGSPPPRSCAMSPSKSSTPYSIRADTGRYGISPRILCRSS